MSALQWGVVVAWIATVGWILIAWQRTGQEPPESDWRDRYPADRHWADDDDDGPWGV